MLEVYTLNPITSNLPINGEFINDIKGYKIVEQNTDLYDGVTGKLVCKFRKNRINDKNIINDFIESNRPLFNRYKETRGAAAGEIDKNKLRHTVKGTFRASNNNYRTGYIKQDGTKSRTTICNLSKSNTIGYLDTAKRAGCISGTHLSRYNLDYPDRYEKSIPLIEKISNEVEQIDKSVFINNLEILNPEYKIGNSCFSTVTINSSWQSACHRDANNGSDSLAAMLVLTDPKNDNHYIGGYFLLPEFKMAFNVRHGDVIICDTQKYLHCNSPLEPSEPNKIVGNYTAQVISNNWYLNRLSVVCYLKKLCLK